MTKIEPRRPQVGLTEVVINLGKGSSALNRWTHLNHLLRIAKQRLRKRGNHDDARAIYDWQLSKRYRVAELAHWTLEMTGEEWQALSRALRLTSTDGRSMLAWLSKRKLDTHGS